MKRKHYISGLIIILAISLFGCSTRTDGLGPEAYFNSGTTPRLVIKGTVKNTADEPLQGIYVAVYGVREADEPDVLTYNYALTGPGGDYTIVRYRGREYPTEVTVVATDSTSVYEEQVLFETITYDSISTRTGKEPFNGLVTADFVLETHYGQQLRR